MQTALHTRGHDSSDFASCSAASLNGSKASIDGLLKHEGVYHSDGAERLEGGASSDNKHGFEDGEPQGPFEGPEKLLELWFQDYRDAVPGQGLRGISRQVWEEMLDTVKCKVLSVIHGNDVDAYLLSESSMFIFPHKLILKTCGTTTLLLGLERILQIARTVFPQASTSQTSLSDERLRQVVKRCFYSRKSFMFPERQKGPHKDWMLEVGLLDRFFSNGSAYTVGKMNGDHWLLYMTTPRTDESFGASNGVVQRPLRPPTGKALSDQTLEILMTHLSPTSCERFQFPSTSQATGEDRGHLLGTQLSDQLGLTSLFAGTKLDGFAFDPCGFSANAIVTGDRGTQYTEVEDHYWTVHVTPEQDSSYASFETNIHMDETGAAGKRDLPWLIQRVLSIFEPDRLSMTLFTSSEGEEEEGSADSVKPPQRNQGDVLHSLQLKGYRRTDRIAYEFEDYDLVFISFDRLDAELPRR